MSLDSHDASMPHFPYSSKSDQQTPNEIAQQTLYYRFNKYGFVQELRGSFPFVLKLRSGHIWFGLVTLALLGQAWFALGELI